jgi:hypothetical protein
VRKTLNDIFAAARERGCAIIHISRLAGEEPFIANSPCLGNASAPLIDITTDDYLAVMADVRRLLSVEHDETLSVQIFTAGARDINVAHERFRTAPRVISGSIEVAGTTAALYYLMDSTGQETTIIYNGLRSFADIQNYWKLRLDLVRTFTGRYAATEEDVYDLCYLFDRMTQLATFDIAAFARERGLFPSADWSAAR